MTGHRIGTVAPTVAVALFTTMLAACLTVAPPTTGGVHLTAGYALKGTQVPGIYIRNDAQIRAQATRVISAALGAAGMPVTVIDYPATLAPLSPRGPFDPTFDRSVAIGLDALRRELSEDPTPVIFGHSQGAIVGTEYKKLFNQQYSSHDPNVAIPRPTWVFIGNPSRPNGVVAQRFKGLYVPFLQMTARGATPTHTAGAGPGEVTTYDLGRQYDFFSDFPAHPANLLAVANAVLGLFFIHTDYRDLSAAVLQDVRGDTEYHLIPTRRLPLLMPLAMLGVPDPILAILDAPLRVLVEAAYQRSVSPGVPTSAGLLPSVSPLKTAADFLRAIRTGFDDGLQQLTGRRPFGTTPAGPYGVGGPPVAIAAGSTDPIAGSTAEDAEDAEDDSTLLSANRPDDQTDTSTVSSDREPQQFDDDAGAAISPALRRGAPASSDADAPDETLADAPADREFDAPDPPQKESTEPDRPDTVPSRERERSTADQSAGPVEREPAA